MTEIPQLASQPFLQNIVTAYIFGSKVHALIDTGATNVCAISKEKLEKLLNGRPIQYKTSKVKGIIVANTMESEVLGEVMVPIKIAQKYFDVELLVLPKLSQDLILGTNFLSKHGAIIDFNANKLSLHTNIPVRLENQVTIPAFSEAVCPGKISNKIQYPNGVIGESNLLNVQFKCNFIVARPAATINENTIPVRLYNYTDRPICLKKDTKVANFHPYSKDTQITSIQPTEKLETDKSVSSNSLFNEINIDKNNLKPSEVKQVQD